MKVTKKGEDVSGVHTLEGAYVGTCFRCGAEFEADASELAPLEKHYSSQALLKECPECGGSIVLFGKPEPPEEPTPFEQYCRGWKAEPAEVQPSQYGKHKVVCAGLVVADAMDKSAAEFLRDAFDAARGE